MSDDNWTTTRYIIYMAGKGFVAKSSPLTFTKDYMKAKIYPKQGLARFSISAHKTRLAGAEIIDVEVTLDPKKIFTHLLTADYN